MPAIRTTVLLFLAFPFISSIAAAQVAVVWAKAPAADNHVFPKGIGADSDGNVYAVTGLRGPVDFGKGPITPPAGQRGLTISKYDPTGFVLGALGTGYASDTIIGEVAVTRSGDIYIVGSFEDDSVDVGGGPIENVNGGVETFLVKYDAFGFYQWALSYDTEFNFGVNWGLAVDNDGNVFLFGTANTGLDLGGGALSFGAFLAKFNGDGDHQWSMNVPDVSAADIAVNPSGAILLLGTFFGTINLGGDDIVATGSGDFFVAQLDGTDAGHEWSSGFASGTPESIASGPLGGVYLSVKSSGMIDFGGGPLSNMSNQALFFAKLNSEGDHVWSRVSSSDSFSPLFARGLAANSAGELFVAGGTDSPIDLGGGDRSAPFAMGGNFMFLAKYDADGEHVWSKAYGSTFSVGGTSIAIDDANRVFLGGVYRGIVDLGTGPFPETTNFISSFVAGFFDASVPIDPANCFIATAAYGSPMADEVDVFRHVRDRFLLETRLGTAFVDFYYEISPPVAGFIEEYPHVRTATRWSLTPLLYYCRALLAAPMTVSAGSLLCLVLMGYCTARLYTRRRKGIRAA